MAEVVSFPPGLLAFSGPDTLLIAKFAVFTAVVLVWTVFWGRILKFFLGVPVIAGQLLSGLFLGPSGMNIAGIPFFAAPFQVSDAKTGMVYAIPSSDLFVFFILLISSSLTVAYLSWVGGRITSIRSIARHGFVAFSSGFFGLLASILGVLGLMCGVANFAWTAMQGTAVGIIFAATSISIPTAILFGYNRMHARSSKATLAAAAADDILTILVLSLFFVSIRAGWWSGFQAVLLPGFAGNFFVSLAMMIASIAAVSAFAYFVVPRIIDFLIQTNRSFLIPPVAFSLIMLYFSLSEFSNAMTGVLGAYFAGLFHRLGSTKYDIQAVLSPFVNFVFVPLSFGSIGLQIDMYVLTWWHWVAVGLLTFVAIASKFIGCLLAVWLNNIAIVSGDRKWQWSEAYFFSSLMVARGEAGIMIAIIMYSSFIITVHQYVIALIAVTITAIVSPIMLSLGMRYVRIKEQDSDGHKVNLGVFGVLGTKNVFKIIENQLKSSGYHLSQTSFSGGREMIDLQDRGVRIVFAPGKGITLEGSRDEGEVILQLVKERLGTDLDRLVVPFEPAGDSDGD